MVQDGLSQKLLDCLEEESRVYRLLSDLLDLEKTHLISSNTQELTENNKAKETTLHRLRALERVRSEIVVDMMSAEPNLQAARQLTDLLPHLPVGHQTKFQGLKTALSTLVGRVREQNEENQELVNSALSVVRGSMDSLKQALNVPPTYKKEGEKNKTQVAAGQLVSREA